MIAKLKDELEYFHFRKQFNFLHVLYKAQHRSNRVDSRPIYWSASQPCKLTHSTALTYHA